MKNIDLFIIRQGIKDTRQLTGVTFAIAMAKNKRIIEIEIEDIEVGIKMSDAYSKYDSQRIELCKHHCKTDSDGNHTLLDNAYIISDKKQFELELNKLKANHKESISERDKQIEDYTKLLEKPTEITLHKISHDDLPDNITSGQTDMIFELIE